MGRALAILATTIATCLAPTLPAQEPGSDPVAPIVRGLQADHDILAALRREHSGEDVLEAVQNCARRLVELQGEDGAWHSWDFEAEAWGVDGAVTCYAMWSLVGLGDEFRPAVQRAADWLLAQQGEDGWFPPMGGIPLVNSQGTVLAALAEVHRVTGYGSRDALQRAVDALFRRPQHPSGWNDDPRRIGVHVETTAMVGIGLVLAAAAGANLLDGWHEPAVRWLDPDRDPMAQPYVWSIWGQWPEKNLGRALLGFSVPTAQECERTESIVPPTWDNLWGAWPFLWDGLLKGQLNPAQRLSWRQAYTQGTAEALAAYEAPLDATSTAAALHLMTSAYRWPRVRALAERVQAAEVGEFGVRYGGSRPGKLVPEDEIILLLDHLTGIQDAYGCIDSDNPERSTAQAILAWSAMWHGIDYGVHRIPLRSAVGWLLDGQGEDGSLAEGPADHALATAALLWVKRTSDALPSAILDEAICRALKHLLTAQLPGGAWPAEADSNRPDLATTWHALQALTLAPFVEFDAKAPLKRLQDWILTTRENLPEDWPEFTTSALRVVVAKQRGDEPDRQDLGDARELPDRAPEPPADAAARIRGLACVLGGPKSFGIYYVRQVQPLALHAMLSYRKWGPARTAEVAVLLAGWNRQWHMVPQ